MPRVVRLRYTADNLPVGDMSARFWLQLVTRDELNRMAEWCEPWPLLRTLTDREVINYVRRYHPTGPQAFFLENVRDHDYRPAA